MLYDTECWTIKNQYIHKMSVAKMRTTSKQVVMLESHEIQKTVFNILNK